MNEAQKNDQLQAVYPQYITAPYAEDEINLVDLWIALWAYNKVFVAVFLLFLVLGAGVGFLVFAETYRLTTGIQVGSVDQGNQIVQIESPQSLKSKMENVLIPRISSKWLKNNPDRISFTTTTSFAKGSNILLIQNKVKSEDIDQFKTFQQLLVTEIVLDHEKLIAASLTDQTKEIESAQAELERLQDPVTLQLETEKKRIALNAVKTKMIRLQDAYQLYKKGGRESVIQFLNKDDREQLQNLEGEIDSRLLEIRFDKLLLDNQILQDNQTQIIQGIELSIKELERELAINIENQKRNVEALTEKLEKANKTRMVSGPVESMKPVGMSKKLVLVLIIFVAGFFAFAAMLIAMFRDKVKERLVETAQN